MQDSDSSNQDGSSSKINLLVTMTDRMIHVLTTLPGSEALGGNTDGLGLYFGDTPSFDTPLLVPHFDLILPTKSAISLDF